MKWNIRRWGATLLVAVLVSLVGSARVSQAGGNQAGRGLGDIGVAGAGPAAQDDGPRLPNGKSQRDAILKADHEQNLKDVARIEELAEELKQELEKNDRFVVSMSSLKKTDEIEKLVKKVRSRLRRN
jgi:hypothetical protein